MNNELYYNKYLFQQYGGRNIPVSTYDQMGGDDDIKSKTATEAIGSLATTAKDSAVGIGTFAAYEIFFFPSYLNSADDISKKKIKMIFVSYHIPWSLMITYIALLDGATWNAWISVAVMYGFTLWGAIAKS